MIKSAHPLCKCGEIADGLDDDFCQDCWEAYCAGAFWRVFNARAQPAENDK